MDEPIDLHCLGGFAVTMRYGLSRTTADIDVLTAIPVVAGARRLHHEPTLRERYTNEYRPNLASGEKKLDQTLELWVEMCWPKTPEG